MVTVIGIMIYLAMRFEWKFSVAGIIANLHDVVIILGFFAFFQWEFSLPVLAASWRCWATRSTSRWSSSTGCARPSASTASSTRCSR